MAAPEIHYGLPRRKRNTFLLAKLEANYNSTTAPTFDFATDALWVEDVTFNYSSNNQTFNAMQPYMGAKIEVAGNDYVDISFKVAFSTTTGVDKDVPFGFLFRACGMKKTAVAAAAGVLQKVIYNPTSDVTNANDSVSFSFIQDKVQYLATGGRGSWKATFLEGGIPGFEFTFKCMFDGSVTNLATVTAPEFGNYRLPRVVNSRNSSAIYMGSTLDLNTLTFSGGYAYASKGVSIDFGNSVEFDSRLGGDRMLITDRNVTGSMQLDIRADAETWLRNQIRANTARSFGFIHGLTDGALVADETCVIYGPSMQLINPKSEDVNSVLYTGFDMRFRSLEKNNDASDNYGDNELSIIFA